MRRDEASRSADNWFSLDVILSPSTVLIFALGLAFIGSLDSGSWKVTILATLATISVFVALIVRSITEPGSRVGRVSRWSVANLTDPFCLLSAAAIYTYSDWLWLRYGINLANPLSLFMQFALLAVACVASTGYWRLWLPGPSRKQIAVTPLNLTTSVLILTAVFVAISIRLYDSGLIVPTEKIEKSESLLRMWGYFVWHACDIVPVLKVPETLNWKVPVKFDDSLSGTLLLMYKVLVAITAINAIKALLNRKQDGDEQTERQEPGLDTDRLT